MKKPLPRKPKRIKYQKPPVDGNYVALKEWLTSMSNEQHEKLYYEMLKARKEWKAVEGKIEKVGLEFVAPTSVEEALQLIADLAFILDFYMNRTGDYNLFMMLSKNGIDYWQVVAKHVVYPDLFVIGTKTLLSNVGKEHINDVSVVMEAIAVFCEGIERVNIPSIYLYYCRGVSKEAVQRMVMDFERLKLELAAISDPSEAFGTIIGKTMNLQTVIDGYVKRMVTGFDGVK